MKAVKKVVVLFSFSLMLIFCILTSPTYPQQKKTQAPKKVLKIKEIIIKQRVIKPQAMFILSKSQQANVKSDITTSQTFSDETIKTIDENFLR